MNKPLSEFEDDLNKLSDQISTQVRAITLGVLAVVWLGLSGSDDIKAFDLSGSRLLVGVGLLCIATLFVDLLQYVFGFKYTLQIYETARAAKQQTAAYDKKHRLYRLRTSMFFWKQRMALAAAALLVGVIGWNLLFVSTPPIPAPPAADQADEIHPAVAAPVHPAAPASVPRPAPVTSAVRPAAAGTKSLPQREPEKMNKQ